MQANIYNLMHLFNGFQAAFKSGLKIMFKNIFEQIQEYSPTYVSDLFRDICSSVFSNSLERYPKTDF